MAGSANCSEGVTREHYVSEAILKRFDLLNVSGMPWQEAEQTQTLPTKALVANILCERHNSALSPVDEMGLRVFDACIAAADYAVSQKYPGRTQHYLISGEGLELWMFKLMAGIHFGGIAKADGRVARENCGIPIERIVEALSTGSLPAGAGLIVAQNTGVVQRSQLSVSPLVATEKNEHIGVRVHFGALSFEATVVPPPVTAAHKARLAPFRRPRVVDFVGPARDARIVLTWKGSPNDVRRVKVEVRP
jgi:hypothetical protein